MADIDNLSVSSSYQRAHFLPAVWVGIAGIFISLVLYLFVNDSVVEKQQQSFTAASNDRVTAFKVLLNHKIEELNSLATFYESSEFVTNKEFKHFISHMIGAKQSVQAYEWAPLIMQDERLQFEQEMRTSGLSDFEVSEKKNESMHRAAERTEYFPVLYVEPLLGNEKLLGYDLSSHPAFNEALQSARRTGLPHSTAGIKLIQAVNEKPSILIFSPVYKSYKENGGDELQGLVTGVYKPDELLSISMNRFESVGIDIHLYDVTTPEEPQLLAIHSSRTRSKKVTFSGRDSLLDQSLQQVATLKLAGRSWKVITTPSPVFFEAHNLWLPLIVLLIGLILTGLLTYLLYSTIRNAERQRQLAQLAISSKDALAFNEQLLSEAQRIAQIGNWHWDIENDTLKWSDQIYRIFGLEPQQFDATYEAFLNSVHPDDRELVNNATMTALENGTPYSIDHRIILANGKTAFVHEQGEVHSKDGKAIRMMGTVQDITEKKRLEEQLLQSQKMEATGTLVGGIAHNFNNMLAGMTGNLYLAKKESSNNPDVVKKLERVEKQSFEAANMIKQLLTFARKGIVEIKPFGLTSFLKEISELRESSIPENIKFNQQLCREELVVAGDATQLQQVLLNLINNARDAVSGVSQPEISLTFNEFEADENFMIAHPNVGGNLFAHLIIKDNGTGINDKDMEHIFEPFYTTKEVGLGTGLGLSMVYGTIQSHGGVIEVDSRLGEGTAFHIYLPLVEEKNIDVTSDQVSEVVSGNGELILLVDDNAEVRSTVKDVLENLGYRVLEASNGLKAVDMFIKGQQDISLIIMDVVMPILGGVQATERIRAISPEAKVIFATGYDKDETLKSEMPADESIILSKPYDISVFSRAIRDQLDS